jgi:hypothetical protein
MRQKIRTAEVVLIAVRQDGLALRDVPEDMRSPEGCLVAVQEKG